MTAKTMADVLAEHQLCVVWQDADETGITCMCGLDVPTEIERNEIDTQWLAAHQAAALSAAGFGLVADAKAEALEEAANDIDSLERLSGYPEESCTDEENAEVEAYDNATDNQEWLRARAAALRGAS